PIVGSTSAGPVANADGWYEAVPAAGDATGEIGWRLPLHPEIFELTKGEYADLTNASEQRKAMSSYAAEFLRQFVDDRPWVHMDIAGTAWGLGRAYVGKGASGFGVRTLVELAERVAGGDVTDEPSAHHFIHAAHEAMGGLDGLINNAGVMLLGPIEGADTDQWRQMVNVNLLGLLYSTQAALPLLRHADGSDIVNVSSVAGRVANPGSAVYNLTKWGVVGFSEALRKEVGSAGIRVTCVEPGFVDTELQGHNENPVVKEAIENMRDQIGEVLTAEDIARTIVYVVSQPQRVSINEVLIRPMGQAR